MSLAEQSQQWYPTSVQVTVLQARGLRIKGKNGTNDAYAIMQVAKDKFSTSVAEKSVAPVWKEEAAFDLPLFHPSNAERCTLQVCVMHRALMGPDKTLGQATVNLLELQDNKSRNKSEWFKLMGKTGKADKDRGEVLLDIQFMRNNMTASMYDLSGQDKSRSRLGKFKDKLKGKKKDGMSDSASAIVPSFGQVLTDSEGEEEPDVTPGAKKKNKLKSLFAPKPGLHRNMSQSMSTLATLPEKDSAISLSRSSGLNVESPEGKKKFKFLKHKRTGSSDSKVSQGTGSLERGTVQGNVCINGSHVYTKAQENRAGSTFSLNSSGHGSMEDLRRGHDQKTSVDSDLQTQENSVKEINIKQEEQRKREAEVRERLDDAEKDERKWIEREQEKKRLDEEVGKRLEREEEKRKLEKQVEERKRIEREEERKRIEREEERKRMEREEEKRKLEKQVEESKRIEREEERKRMEREEERKRMEREEEKRKLERQEEGRKKIERDEERKRIEREEEQKRMEKEEEKRKLEKKEAERKRTEKEEMERKRIEQDEMTRIKEQERIRQEEEKRVVEEERIKEEKRKRTEKEEKIRKEEEKRRKMEEEERTRLENENLRKKGETEKIEMERRAEDEERRRKEKEKVEAEEKRKREEERRMTEETKAQERLRLEKEKVEFEKKKIEERMRGEQVRKMAEEEEKRKLKEKADQEKIEQEKEEMERQGKTKEQRPEVKPRSARLNTSKKAPDEINSDYTPSTNPFEDLLSVDESFNPFEHATVPQPEALSRSTKVSAVKPRPHAVKPLSTTDNHPDLRETQDSSRSATITDEIQVKMKAPEAKGRGPYSQLTNEELINLLEKQKVQLSQKDSKIGELELYIDNLLVRVMEKNPEILMSLTSMKKSV
ncbi:rab11 family-interacting protein [Pimephales promelas]|nr:rab11 family-interacting protein [Pimephales promelas]